MDSGIGSGTPYECVVAEKNTPALKMKKVTFVALYVLWAAAFLLVGGMTKLILPLLAFIPITTWILVWLTWKYVQVEYEYSVFSGVITVSRIYGGKKRKQLVSVRIKELSAVVPYTDEHIHKVNNFEAQKTVMAASCSDAPSAYIALWTDSDTRMLLCFEPDEKILKLIKYYNASCLSK